MTLAELWDYVHQVERNLQVDLAKVDSMELVEPHEHHCTECGQTWSHVEYTDEVCSWKGNVMTGLPCPKCKDAYLLDLYAGDPPDTPDILDEDVALEMMEKPDPEWGDE